MMHCTRFQHATRRHDTRRHNSNPVSGTRASQPFGSWCAGLCTCMVKNDGSLQSLGTETRVSPATWIQRMQTAAPLLCRNAAASRQSHRMRRHFASFCSSRAARCHSEEPTVAGAFFLQPPVCRHPASPTATIPLKVLYQSWLRY